MKYQNLSFLFFFTLLLLITGCRGQDTAPEPVRFLQGQYAYLPHEESLVIVDISRPEEPRQVGRIALGSQVTGVAPAGDVVYVLRHTTLGVGMNNVLTPGGVVTVDVTDPANPAIIGELHGPEYPQSLLLLTGGSDLLLISDFEALYSIDVRRPDLPTLRHRDHLGDYPGGFASMLQVDQTLYGFSGSCNMRHGGCSGMITRFDLSTGRPVAEQQTILELPMYDAAIVDDILYTGGFGYAAAPLNDPAALGDHYRKLPIGYYQTRLASTATHLFLTGNDRLLVLDLANRLSPEPAAEVAIAPEGTYYLDIARQGDLLYLVSQYGLHVVDISDPLAPRQIAQLDLTG